jgi:hypothetical protein
MVGLMVGWPVGLSVGLLVILSVGQSVCWLICRSVGRFVSWSVDLSVVWLVCWLVCWSVWWCVGWCISWLVGPGYVMLVREEFSPQFSNCTPRTGLHRVMSSHLRSRGPVWALTLVVTLSRACALHKGMLWDVKLGMLWGTLKSTFCHRSPPNRSNSKNEVYPRIGHDAESLKYSYKYN